MSRARSYCFTLNNWTVEQRDAIHSLDCVYLDCYEETGKQGTAHLQGFICFENARSLSAVSKLLFNAHVEPKRGTFKEASEYCKKGTGTPDAPIGAVGFSKGVLPMDQVAKGHAEIIRWKTALEAVQEGRLEDVCPQILCTSLAKIEYAVARLESKKRKFVDLETFDNEWHWGPPKSGKSATQKDYPDHYKKMSHNKWWDHYEFQEVVFIDDFADRKLLDELLNWADLYPTRAEFKGGSMLIRPKKIIVTAQSPPYYYSDDPVRQEALARRFRVVEHVHDPEFSRSQFGAINRAEGGAPPEGGEGAPGTINSTITPAQT